MKITKVESLFATSKETMKETLKRNEKKKLEKKQNERKGKNWKERNRYNDLSIKIKSKMKKLSSVSNPHRSSNRKETLPPLHRDRTF